MAITIKENPSSSKRGDCMKKVLLIAYLTIVVSLMALAYEVQALDVDLERYAGKWYEIGRYGLFFEMGLTNVTAEYTLMDDGMIQVVNQGYYGGLDGLKSSIKGTAYAPNPDETGKLLVRFFSTFESDYWVIDLDEDNYSYSIVSQPSKKFLWILSRTPKMDPQLYNELIEKLRSWDFPVEKIEKVVQDW